MTARIYSDLSLWFVLLMVLRHFYDKLIFHKCAAYGSKTVWLCRRLCSQNENRSLLFQTLLWGTMSDGRSLVWNKYIYIAPTQTIWAGNEYLLNRVVESLDCIFCYLSPILIEFLFPKHAYQIPWYLFKFVSSDILWPQVKKKRPQESCLLSFAEQVGQVSH